MEIHQQLKQYVQSPSAYWIANKKGELQKSNFFRFAFETIKGWLGGGNRGGAEAIDFRVIYLVEELLQQDQHANLEDKIKLIDEVATKMGVMPKHLETSHSLKALIQEIQKNNPTFSEIQNIHKNSEDYFKKHVKILSPIFPSPPSPALELISQVYYASRSSSKEKPDKHGENSSDLADQEANRENQTNRSTKENSDQKSRRSFSKEHNQISLNLKPITLTRSSSSEELNEVYSSVQSSEIQEETSNEGKKSDLLESSQNINMFALIILGVVSLAGIVNYMPSHLFSAARPEENSSEVSLVKVSDESNTLIGNTTFSQTHDFVKVQPELHAGNSTLVEEEKNHVELRPIEEEGQKEKLSTNETLEDLNLGSPPEAEAFQVSSSNLLTTIGSITGLAILGGLVTRKYWSSRVYQITNSLLGEPLSPLEKKVRENNSSFVTRTTRILDLNLDKLQKASECLNKLKGKATDQITEQEKQTIKQVQGNIPEFYAYVLSLEIACINAKNEPLERQQSVKKNYTDASLGLHNIVDCLKVLITNNLDSFAAEESSFGLSSGIEEFRNLGKEAKSLENTFTPLSNYMLTLYEKNPDQLNLAWVIYERFQEFERFFLKLMTQISTHSLEKSYSKALVEIGEQAEHGKISEINSPKRPMTPDEKIKYTESLKEELHENIQKIASFLKCFALNRARLINTIKNCSGQLESSPIRDFIFLRMKTSLEAIQKAIYEYPGVKLFPIISAYQAVQEARLQMLRLDDLKYLKRPEKELSEFKDVEATFNVKEAVYQKAINESSGPSNSNQKIDLIDYKTFIDLYEASDIKDIPTLNANEQVELSWILMDKSELLEKFFLTKILPKLDILLSVEDESSARFKEAVKDFSKKITSSIQKIHDLNPQGLSRNHRLNLSSYYLKITSQVGKPVELTQLQLTEEIRKALPDLIREQENKLTQGLSKDELKKSQDEFSTVFRFAFDPDQDFNLPTWSAELDFEKLYVQVMAAKKKIGESLEKENNEELNENFAELHAFALMFCQNIRAITSICVSKLGEIQKGNLEASDSPEQYYSEFLRKYNEMIEAVGSVFNVSNEIDTLKLKNLLTIPIKKVSINEFLLSNQKKEDKKLEGEVLLHLEGDPDIKVERETQSSEDKETISKETPSLEKIKVDISEVDQLLKNLKTLEEQPIEEQKQDSIKEAELDKLLSDSYLFAPNKSSLDEGGFEKVAKHLDSSDLSETDFEEIEPTSVSSLAPPVDALEESRSRFSFGKITDKALNAFTKTARKIESGITTYMTRGEVDPDLDLRCFAEDYGKDEKAQIEAGRARINKRGGMLNGTDVKNFITGIWNPERIDKDVLHSFYIGSKQIGDFEIDQIKNQISELRKTWDATSPICIPVTFDGVRNHIAVILINNGIVSYYDPQGTPSKKRKIKNSSLNEILNHCQTTFEAKEISDLEKRHQKDIHNCGVFVSRYIYNQVIEKRPLNLEEVPSIKEINQFRRKISEIAYGEPKFSSTMNSLLQGQELKTKLESIEGNETIQFPKQFLRDLEGLGSISIRREEGARLIYPNVEVNLSEQEVFEAIDNIQSGERTPESKAQLRTFISALIDDKNPQLEKSRFNRLTRLLTQAVCPELLVNALKRAEPKDDENGPLISHGGAMHFTLEKNPYTQEIRVEIKLVFDFARVDDEGNKVVDGYIVAKRSSIIPLDLLDNPNLESLDDEILKKNIKVYDKFSKKLTNIKEAKTILVDPNF